MKIYDSVLKMILTKKLEIFQASVSEKSLLVLLFASYYFTSGTKPKVHKNQYYIMSYFVLYNLNANKITKIKCESSLIIRLSSDSF